MNIKTILPYIIFGCFVLSLCITTGVLFAQVSSNSANDLITMETIQSLKVSQEETEKEIRATIAKQINDSITTSRKYTLEQRQPIYQGSRDIIVSPDGNPIEYGKDWVHIGGYPVYNLFSYGLGSLPATPGYTRKYRFNVVYTDNITDTGKTTELEICTCGFACGDVNNDCSNDNVRLFNLPLTWGGTSAAAQRDWYSDWITSFGSAHARIRVRIQPGTKDLDTRKGLIYRFRIEAWDIPE